jgi:hypothetical protein
MIKSGKIKILVQLSNKGLPELNAMGIPLAISYAHDEEKRRILETFDSGEDFVRPYLVAPEVPPERLEMLRKAFMDTWHDPDLVAEAARLNLDIGPISGEEVQARLKKIYDSPPAFLTRVRDAIRQK